MNKVKMIVSIALVLLVGILAGSLGTRMYMRSETERSHHDEDKIKRILKRLTGDLHLSSAQQAEIEKILVLTDAKVSGLKASCEPDVKKLYEQSFTLIKEKLNDEQKGKLQSRQERFSRRFNTYYFKSLRVAWKALPDVAAMKARLGLDASQEQEVAKILEDLRAGQERIIGKYEKMDNPDLAAVRSELAEAEKNMAKRLHGVLTEKQIARYRETQ